MKRKLTPQWLKRLLNLWPPYLGAGIKVLEISDRWDFAKVKLKKTKLNSNYFGTAYGGSLFSMTDPFYVLLLANRLGRDYIVWDKGASIKYISPGRTDVFCEFRLTDDQVEAIREQAHRLGKYEPEFEVDVVDTENKLVAKVFKKLYVKPKQQ
jgi:acyl-coenzyme A thioesterase PaaI-like protein